VLKTVTHGLVMSTHTIGRRSSARANIARCMLSSCVRPSVHHNASTVSKRRRSRLKCLNISGKGQKPLICR